jgi:hypothetical protein
MSDGNPSINTSQDANVILANLLLQEKAEAAEARKIKAARLATREKNRLLQDAQKVENEIRRQGNCDHLQGNHKLGEMPFKEVSHLSLHTFQDNSKRIRCNKCGFKWFPGDTASTIKRGKETMPNPTGWGWQEAYKQVMKFKNQGNKPSTGFLTFQLADQNA